MQLRTQQFIDPYTGKAFPSTFDAELVTKATHLPIGLLVEHEGRHFVSYIDAQFHVRGQEKIGLAGTTLCQPGCECRCPPPGPAQLEPILARAREIRASGQRAITPADKQAIYALVAWEHKTAKKR